jgi:hypothetical protein
MGDLCIQLKGSHLFQDGFRHTYIVTNHAAAVREIFLHRGIDVDRYIILADEILEEKYPGIAGFADLHPQLGGWLKQQMIKLSALDYLDYDVMAIQDPDTFWTRPWQQLDHRGEPVLLAIPEHSESPDYYRIFQDLTGLPRAGQDCYVTEFMMVKKTDWTSLRDLIQTRSGQSWMASIRDCIRPDHLGMPWFSEYELLGNWIVQHRPDVTQIPQRRLEIRQWADLERYTDQDVICNADKDKDIFGIDWYGDKSINQERPWAQRFPAYQ